MGGSLFPSLFKSSYQRNWIAFWILGTINNLAYVVVNSAAKSLTTYFHHPNLIGLILGANIAFGFFARAINTVFLEYVPHSSRSAFTSLIMFVGLVGIPFSIYVDSFVVCLVAIVLIGCTSSFGESVLLGYMKGYPPEIVNGWSSGTGMAGVAGSLIYVFFVAIGFSDTQSFLSLVPLALIYWVVFYWMLAPPPSQNVQSKPEDIEKESLVAAVKIDESATASLLPKETKQQRYIRCFKMIWFVSSQLMLVYFFEYVASIGGSAQAADGSSWFLAHAYEILAFCYQLGVFVSRSSLSIIKIKRVEILTVFQGINMVFWILQAKYKFISGNVGIWILFILMVYVGLLGGASYVNVFYLILHDEKIPDVDRELCVNIAAILITVGITLASLFILLINNTFLKE